MNPIVLHVPRGPSSVTISHAAERTYTQGSVAFGPFLGVPKIENYMIINPKSSQRSRFLRGRVKTLKTRCPCIDDPKFDDCLRLNFTIIFSGNPQNVTLSSIFAESKTLEKMMEITRFDVLREPFIDLDQASRRMRKITQNDVKLHLKSPQN